MTPSEIIDLARYEIVYADAAYYSGHESDYTDREYDTLRRWFALAAPEDELNAKVGSPPGEGVRPLSKVRHEIPMGSLRKADDEAELLHWYVQLGSPEVTVSQKLDGASLAARYERGHLVQAVTRGDGVEGEDITHNAVKFRGLPLETDPEFNGWVRGEVVLEKEDWAEVDPDQASNPRSLAAGIMRRLDGRDAEKLSFYAFDEDSFLWPLGFQVVVQCVCEDFNTLLGFYNEVLKHRADLPYWIDGVVIRVRDVQQFESLGSVSNRPRGAIAYKFDEVGQETTLRSVTWSVGHTGRVTPVAHFDPVRIDGTTVGKATLHNFDEISRLGIALGDRIEVIKAGDIIPRVAQRVRAGKGREVITAPSKCPICYSDLTTRQNTSGEAGVDIYCSDPQCPAQARGKIKRWLTSTNTLGIGDEVLDELIDRGWVAEVVDLYQIDMDDLVRLEVNGRKLGKRGETIWFALQGSRQLTWTTFLGSLGVQHLGKRRVEQILQAASGELRERLCQPAGWLTDEQGRSLLVEHAAELGIPNMAGPIQAGLDAIRGNLMVLLTFIDIDAPALESSPLAPDSPFAGQSYCFTGVRPTGDQQRMLIALGGEIKSGVSKGLTYLVCKDPESTSSKATKARSLGVEVISMDSLVRELEDWAEMGREV